MFGKNERDVVFSYFLLERLKDQPASKLSPRNSAPFFRAEFSWRWPVRYRSSRKLHIICRQRDWDGSCRLKATVNTRVVIRAYRVLSSNGGNESAELFRGLISRVDGRLLPSLPFLLPEEERGGGTFARVGRVICLIAPLQEALARVTRPRVAATHAPLNRNSRPLTTGNRAPRRFFHPPMEKLVATRKGRLEGGREWDEARRNVARPGAIFTERLKAENGKWEAEIEWREKRDVSRPMEEGRGGGEKTNRAGAEEGWGRCSRLLTRHVSVVSRARDLRLDRLPLIRESGLLMRGEYSRL